MTADQIDTAYNALVSSIDREFRRLKQALAEQEMKEEAERLKKIQVNISCLSQEASNMIYVRRASWKMKKTKSSTKINVSSKRRKNFDSKNCTDVRCDSI
jgi:hypothetical protein